jgi:hypothetical protein
MDDKWAVTILTIRRVTCSIFTGLVDWIKNINYTVLLLLSDETAMASDIDHVHPRHGLSMA